MELINQIKNRARNLHKRIVLPEGTEIRTLKATEIVLKDHLAELTLLGDPLKIKEITRREGIDITGASLIDPTSDPKRAHYSDLMVEIRKDKGLTKEEALKLLDDSLYYGPMMIKAGDADGELSGAVHATGDVLRPAFQFIKTLPGASIVSGTFFLIFENKNLGDKGILVFADCAVNPNPDDRQLAEIAVATARTARQVANIEPRVAMLSFSTKGSAKHDMVDKVVRATKLAREMDPELMIDGELQLDAAIVEEVGKLKAPDSKVAGRANVLIFPTLESGNIGYKLVQRLAGAEAIGPVLQGMAAPVNDLSRGCSVNDIVTMIAITANQAM